MSFGLYGSRRGAPLALPWFHPLGFSVHVLIRWQLEQTTSHLAISARNAVSPALNKTAIPLAGYRFLFGSRWSKSMTTAGNLFPQSAHGTSLAACAMALLRRRLLDRESAVTTPAPRLRRRAHRPARASGRT